MGCPRRSPVGDVPALSVSIVNLDPAWAEALEAIELLAFPLANPEDLFSVDVIRAYAKVFPEGYFVALDDGVPVGQGAGIYLDFDFSPHFLQQSLFRKDIPNVRNIFKVNAFRG